MPPLRAAFQRRRRFSASSIASRRASRFWRWRSRLVALGTAGESTDGVFGRRIAGGLSVRWTVVTLLVQKFGGTSVADPDRIRAVAEHIVRTRRAGHDVVVVVSAMGKTTDDLERLAHDVATEPAAREMDMLLTSGERISIALLCMAIIDLGEAAVSFTGSQAGIVTDTAHRKAKILEIRGDRLREAIAAGTSQSSPASRACRPPATSPRSAAAAPTPLRSRSRPRSDADVCEIYTDVAGRVHRRPRIVPDARRLARLSYDEMLEMSATGRPRARAALGRVRPQLRACPCTCARASPGSRAPGCTRRSPSMEQPIISGVTHDASEAKVTIFRVPDRPGIAATVFRALADENVNVDMIEQNVSTDDHTDISFTVPRDELSVHDDVIDKVVVDDRGRWLPTTTPRSAGCRWSVRA